MTSSEDAYWEEIKIKVIKKANDWAAGHVKLNLQGCFMLWDFIKSAIMDELTKGKACVIGDMLSNQSFLVDIPLLDLLNTPSEEWTGKDHEFYQKCMRNRSPGVVTIRPYTCVLEYKIK